MNSAFYGQVREIGTISRALQILGLNSVKTLALGFSLVGNLKKSGGTGFDHIAYWRRSLSQIAGIVQHEKSFLGGLLQDVGMVALGQALGNEYADVLQAAGSDHTSLRDREIQAFGIDRAEVGAALAESWKLPSVLVAPIRHHEALDNADPELQTLVRSVSLGHRVADVFLHPEGNAPALDTYYGQAASWFALERDQAETTLREIHEQTQKLGDLFDLPTGNLRNSDEILSRANEALMQITLQSQQENTELITKISTDALTGVGNRRAFDQWIAEKFSAATSSKPLSLIFADVDHIKRFNDTYGHGVGDRVLAVFAKTLRIAPVTTARCSDAAAKSSPRCAQTRDPRRQCEWPNGCGWLSRAEHVSKQTADHN